MTPAAWADIDLAAISHNVGVIGATSGTEVMAVVKADAYGHGLQPSARAARAGGASWLGVAFIDEALALRAGGDTGRILAWLHPSGTDFTEAVAADIDLSVSGVAQLEALIVAGESAQRMPRVHLKADTGLSRGGAMPEEWDALTRAAGAAKRDGRIEVVAVWSHLAHGDEPKHDVLAQQAAAFRRACAVATASGVGDVLLHLANSGAALSRPDLALDLVRAGIATYGISPGPGVGTSSALGLRPAMALRAQVAQVKRVPAGQGVSYSHRYTTARETVLALVPLGYADGLPRAGTNVGPLLIGDQRATVSGTVCMDQVMVDLGPDSQVAVGDLVTVFGSGAHGAPTAEEWARACGTIAYEIVTRIGPRVQRRYGELV